jgi:hypothetical protein
MPHWPPCSCMCTDVVTLKLNSIVTKLSVLQILNWNDFFWQYLKVHHTCIRYLKCSDIPRKYHLYFSDSHKVGAIFGPYEHS